jgi:hypothetical protein
MTLFDHRPAAILEGICGAEERLVDAAFNWKRGQ